MKKQGTTWHSFAALAVLVTCGPVCFAGDGADGKSAPKPLPAAIVKAWEDIGAEVGWMKVVPPQRVGYHRFWEPWQEKGESGTIPAFRIGRMKKGALTKLPAPGVPFGLDFHCGACDGATLKELAGLKNLQVLNVGATQMRGEDLKELAGLKHLKGLYLFYTYRLSEARLKDVAAM